MSDVGCVDDEAALLYVSGAIDGDRRTAIDLHLDGCPACRRLISELVRDERSERTPLPENSARLDKIGRFLVLGLVGVGGMGAVYAAYDPELDRKVAIKLLHPHSGSDAEADNGALMTEAKAMASLMHPHVVAVYDVGIHDSAPFIAMEYIAGQNLRQWLRSETRPTAEIVNVMVGAGRGLAAAHRAGLVHRDFKPDNVLVTEDGKAKVTDFGLALRGERRNRDVSGTPAYMSPEQRGGNAIDARSDQYSFAITLYEALFDERPTGPAMVGGVLSPPAKGRTIDASLRRALARALAGDANARFASMDALLDEIVVAPRRRRRRVTAMGLAVVVLAGAGFAFARDEARRAAACSGVSGGVEVAWNGAVRTRLRARFGASQRPYARGALPTVERAIETYATELIQEETRSCTATRMRGDQSEEMFALRSACFRQREIELGAMTGLLADADDDVIEHASLAVAKLTPVRACSSGTTLAMQPLPPEGSSLRLAVEQLRVHLAQAQAALESGQSRRGTEVAAACVQDAERLAYAPVLAEALFVRGALADATSDFSDSEGYLTRAAEVAEASRHDEIGAKSRTLLVWVTGYRRARHEVGHALESTARGSVARAGRRPDLEAALENNVGTLLWAEGKHAPAAERFERARALWELAFGPDHPLVADALNNRALTLWNLGNLEEALEFHEDAMARRSRRLGPDHPAVASSLNNIGLVAQDMGQFERARDNHERALRIRVDAHGETHPLVASALNNLGLAELGLGALGPAREHLSRGLAIRKATLGESHPEVANSLVNLAIAEVSDSNWDNAQRYVEQARAIQERHLSPSHPALVDTFLVQARVLAATGELREALRQAREALAVAQTALGAEHPSTFAALAEEGAELLALGQISEAQRALTRVVDHAERLADSLVVGTAAVDLLDALSRSGPPPASLQTLARRRLRMAGARGEKPLARLDRLMAETGARR